MELEKISEFKKVNHIIVVHFILIYF